MLNIFSKTKIEYNNKLYKTYKLPLPFVQQVLQNKAKQGPCNQGMFGLFWGNKFKHHAIQAIQHEVCLVLGVPASLSSLPPGRGHDDLHVHPDDTPHRRTPCPLCSTAPEVVGAEDRVWEPAGSEAEGKGPPVSSGPPLELLYPVGPPGSWGLRAVGEEESPSA